MRVGATDVRGSIIENCGQWRHKPVLLLAIVADNITTMLSIIEILS
ncbi:hypothetical protein NIES4071_34770 [Calothrix sp. NIES-4071]|nr:hypothetical protein NIES4071_34770 [Calothrix sp. NIES-4071]BAZ57796.1 hypothetical protein NIES4105_34700 [Calothrix sp. NIES-4105]